MNWYILVLIIDVPAVHLSIFYLGSDIQGWKMNTEGLHKGEEFSGYTVFAVLYAGGKDTPFGKVER